MGNKVSNAKKGSQKGSTSTSSAVKKDSVNAGSPSTSPKAGDAPNSPSNKEAGGGLAEEKDLAAVSNEKYGAMLKNVPLLAKLTERERATLGGALVEQTFKDKQNIITEGEEGHGFYIISKGEVIVTRMDEKKEVTELGRLKLGDFFGESALINNAKRGATVTANGAVTVFYLERSKFLALFNKSKLNIQFAKRKAISAEREEESISKVPRAPPDAQKQKPPAVRKLILGAVKDNVLFMNLDPEHQNSIINEMYRAEIKEGVTAIRQGETGDNLYVVESGEFTVLVNDQKVAVRGPGTCFGELALMYNAPRAATVMAATAAVVWVIDRFTFRRIVTDLSVSKFSTYVKFLKRVELLIPLAEYEREKIAEALEEVTFNAGDVIMKQGDEGDCMFIVYSGEVVVTKSENGEPAVEVNRCQKGDYFGERALMKNEARAATCTAVSPAICLRLDQSAFNLLLGPLEDIMKKKVQSYDEMGKASGDRGSISQIVGAQSFATMEQPKIAYTDLQVLGTLGKGSFGHVQLVKDKKTGQTYALKAVSKAQIVQTGQQGHIMSEKKVMAALKHPFLVQLYATYKDQDRLFFLLEASLGGELFSVLREKTLFDEDTARFYAASVVCAFEYMHSKNIIYRDLKPENLLLDDKGYLKVTDFGFAKDISSGRTWTLCGTPDYLSPEIVAGKGHGKGVDWWTLGIFIYEMLASYPPFYDEDPMKTYAKIMHGTITFPSHFSKEAVSLIKKLLHHKSTKRLGVVKGGAKLIKKHAWFRGFDWDALLAKKLKAPIVPKIKSNTDISNFDDYPPEEEDNVQHYVDDGTSWDAEF